MRGAPKSSHPCPQRGGSRGSEIPDALPFPKVVPCRCRTCTARRLAPSVNRRGSCRLGRRAGHGRRGKGIAAHARGKGELAYPAATVSLGAGVCRWREIAAKVGAQRIESLRHATRVETEEAPGGEVVDAGRCRSVRPPASMRIGAALAGSRRDAPAWSATCRPTAARGRAEQPGGPSRHRGTAVSDLGRGPQRSR